MHWYRFIWLLNGTQRWVDELPDVRLLCLVPQGFPTGIGRHPEHVLLGVEVPIFQCFLVNYWVISQVVVGLWVLTVASTFCLLPLLHEGVGDVFEEDQTQDLMLVFSSIPLGTEFVR